MDWQPIETAPRDRPILIAGGDYDWDTGYGASVPFDGVTIACWIDGIKSGWQGENCGGHDQHFWYRPTHWMPLPEPPQA